MKKNILLQRLMGLDIGNARIGVALSDPLALTSQPYLTIEKRSNRQALNDIIAIVRKNNIHIIVGGFPRDLNGNLTEQSRKTHSFFKKLRRILENDPQLNTIKMYLWDERMTSLQASRITQGSKLNYHDKRGALDRISAALILDSFITYTQNTRNELNP